MEGNDPPPVKGESNRPYQSSPGPAAEEAEEEAWATFVTSADPSSRMSLTSLSKSVLARLRCLGALSLPHLSMGSNSRACPMEASWLPTPRIKANDSLWCREATSS